MSWSKACTAWMPEPTAIARAAPKPIASVTRDMSVSPCAAQLAAPSCFRRRARGTTGMQTVPS